MSLAPRNVKFSEKTYLAYLDQRSKEIIMNIECVDCGTDFTFSAGQQAYFSKKGFDPPKRCNECKKKKKEFHRSLQDAMDNNYVASAPKDIVHCEWCGNPGHRESYCRYKQSATCTICGKIGRPGSQGFAMGLRTNVVHMACNCAEERAKELKKPMR